MSWWHIFGGMRELDGAEVTAVLKVGPADESEGIPPWEIDQETKDEGFEGYPYLWSCDHEPTEEDIKDWEEYLELRSLVDPDEDEDVCWAGRKAFLEGAWTDPCPNPAVHAVVTPDPTMPIPKLCDRHFIEANRGGYIDEPYIGEEEAKQRRPDLFS